MGSAESSEAINGPGDPVQPPPKQTGQTLSIEATNCRSAVMWGFSIHRVRPRRNALLLNRVWSAEVLEDRTLLSPTSGALLPSPASEGGGPEEITTDASLHESADLLVRFHEQAGCSASSCDEAPEEIVPGVIDVGPAFSLLPGLHAVRLSDGQNLDAVLDAFRNHPLVNYAEPNLRVQLEATPNDPQFDSLWGLNNTGQTGGIADADIDAPEAWDITTGSDGTLVAVLDTGVDYLHEDLAGNIWVNADETPGDGIDNDGNGYVDDFHGYDFANGDGDPRDDHNHGTHVAGTIGAVGDNGIGVAGVNWNVQIMALKFLDSSGNGSIADAIEALNYAVANGATISNNSWGFNGSFSQALEDAIAAARDAGHIFVAAAGNGNIFGIGQDNDETPFWPASHDLDNVISVAALDHNDDIATFSNYGETSVDLGAPGVDILSTTRNDTYSTFDGTSMATPHVTGVAALLRDLHPDWTYQQIIDRITETVDPVEALQGLTVTGGRVNAFGVLAPEVLGPWVVSQSPSGSVSRDVSRLRITFSDPLEAATFTVEDVAEFNGPSGGIPVNEVTIVPGSNNRAFDITFPTQSEVGTYSMVLGPEITDADGMLMDQDRDGTGGEAIEDQYTAAFTIEPFSMAFDFGTDTSPVEPDYVGIRPEDTYSASTGYGWTNGSIFATERINGTALTKDLAYSGDLTFSADLDPGIYDVILTVGDTGSWAHNEMGVFGEGAQLDTLNTAAGEIITRTYRVTVSDGQLNLRMQDLGGSDPNVVLNGLDVVFVGPDEAGPKVIETDPDGTASGSLDRITLTFNETIDETTLTLDDVVNLTGPDGSIAPTAVNKLSDAKYDVVFDPQTTLGDYSLTVGPEIRDAAGNLMDQDEDDTGGEPVDDRFTTTVTLEPFSAAYDFGSGSSPVETGYTGVDPSTAYDPNLGYGWMSGSVSSAVRSNGTALTRDLNFSSEMTFAVDVSDGTYNVTLTLGDTGGYAHDDMGVYVEGIQIDTVSTAAQQVVTKVYTVSVADGQLNLRLADLGGSDPNTVINGLEVVFDGPDTAGPQVIDADPTGIVTESADRITLTFNEPIAEGTFALEDVVSLTGPNGDITPVGVNKLDAAVYEVVFEPQTAGGDYSLTVGPDVADSAGNLMNQDGDGLNGESPDDQFTTGFTLVAFAAAFDFGTDASPVAEGSTRIAPDDTYASAVGHGWTSGTVRSVDRLSGTELTRDLNYSSNMTFAVDLPAETFDVTLTLGDTGPWAHDQMGIFLENVHADTLSTNSREVLTRTYRVEVTDGQLTLRLEDLGGGDPNAVINGLSIVTVDGTSANSAGLTSSAPASDGPAEQARSGRPFKPSATVFSVLNVTGEQLLQAPRPNASHEKTLSKSEPSATVPLELARGPVSAVLKADQTDRTDDDLGDQSESVEDDASTVLHAELDWLFRSLESEQGLCALDVL